MAAIDIYTDGSWDFQLQYVPYTAYTTMCIVSKSGRVYHTPN